LRILHGCHVGITDGREPEMKKAKWSVISIFVVTGKTAKGMETGTDGSDQTISLPFLTKLSTVD
jgi:hypothetical protein